MSDKRIFIEIDSAALGEKGQAVAGDVCLHRRVNGRSVVVLSDGSGSGVRANVIAQVIASMAVNYTLSDEPPLRAAQTIIRTFVSDNDGPGRHATFTILDIRRNGEIHIAEFGNPLLFHLRGGAEIALQREEVMIDDSKLYLSVIKPVAEDRIILFSDGVTMSGRMTRRLPDGWGMGGVAELCGNEITADNTVSASKLCRRIVAQAEINDLFAAKNDMSCVVVYFRQPRRIIVLSGPPYNEHKDDILADMVAGYEGTRLICGGTTAQIVSRELGRELNVVLKRDLAGLPPISTIEGIDLITEGVLTLGKVKGLLERARDTDIKEKGTDGVVARMLLEHDVIDFVVGTRINPRHQDPNLPVELEVRRNLIKDLASILENKFMKEVKVQYI